MFENPRRGRQARNFTTNVPKILDLKSSSEQIFSRKLTLGAAGQVLIAYLFAGNKRDVSGKDFQLARRDFKQLLEHIDDVEKSLAKISELKEVYHKMEGHWIHSNNQRGAKETNRVIL